MVKKTLSFLSSTKLIWRITLGLFAFLVLLFISITHFNITGDFEGLYVLECDRGLLFDIDDDISFGDEARLIFRMDFGPIKDYLRTGGFKIAAFYHHPDDADLRTVWSERQGRGYVFAHLPGNRRFLTCFGRYRDSDGMIPQGLFVGGGLPFSKHENAAVTLNETGMAYFDGVKWRHLWCNTNEAISPVSRFQNIPLTPSSWKFLGSKVLVNTSTKVVIKSSHEIDIPAMHLRIDRYAFFKAGDAHVILAMIIKNIGPRWAMYLYIYGDEPWVGDYGSSVGNVGWVKDRLYQYEGRVDTSRYSHAGMYDIGNTAVPGEKGTFTGIANFIEWMGDVNPGLVYFSNTIGQYSEEAKKVPLSDKLNRVLFLEWGPMTLEPNRQHVYILGLGMAGIDRETGLPVKPTVDLSDEDREYLKQ